MTQLVQGLQQTLRAEDEGKEIITSLEGGEVKIDGVPASRYCQVGSVGEDPLQGFIDDII